MKICTELSELRNFKVTTFWRRLDRTGAWSVSLACTAGCESCRLFFPTGFITFFNKCEYDVLFFNRETKLHRFKVKYRQILAGINLFCRGSSCLESELETQAYIKSKTTYNSHKQINSNSSRAGVMGWIYSLYMYGLNGTSIQPYHLEMLVPS